MKSSHPQSNNQTSTRSTIIKWTNHLSTPSGELPGNQTLYEFFYDGEKKQWIPWSKMVPAYVHNPDLKFYEILVPTVDTVRATWLLEMMVNIKRPVVLVGETGTSKTATIANFLRTVDQETHVSFGRKRKVDGRRDRKKKEKK